MNPNENDPFITSASRGNAPYDQQMSSDVEIGIDSNMNPRRSNSGFGRAGSITSGISDSESPSRHSKSREKSMLAGHAGRTRSGGVILLAGIPFAAFMTVFTTLLWSHTFRSLHVLFMVVGIGCSLFCMAMDRKTRRKWWFYIGGLSLLGTICAWTFGKSIYLGFIEPYLMMTQNNYYNNVLPSELAAAHSDAGVMKFASTAMVDVSKAVCRKNNQLFCVAPVLSAYMTDGKVEYWAAGLNCGDSRGSFHCDDAMSPTARYGIVKRAIPNIFGNYGDTTFDEYKKAVALSEASYDLTSAKDPIFLKWVEDADVIENWYYNWGLTSYLIVMFAYLGFSVGAGMFFHNVWKRSVE